MSGATHPLKQALIDLAEWHDYWKDEPGLETLVEAVRGAWVGYVAANCEMPRRRGGRLAEVIPLRPRDGGLRLVRSPALRRDPDEAGAGE